MNIKHWAMNRRQWLALSGAAFAARPGAGQTTASQTAGPAEKVEPDRLLLKDYRPNSIFKIPVTEIKRAKFPVWDAHCHPRAKSPEDVTAIVKIMDEVGVEKTVIVSRSNGERFNELHRLYSKYPGRFELFCGFDFSGLGQPGFGPSAIKELERCHKVGATGIGETTDKGLGLDRVIGTGAPAYLANQRANQRTPDKSMGLHPDDPLMDMLWERCAQLGMPIILHMSDPIWGYLPQDRHNDGLMNGFSWRLDNRPDLLSHEGLLQSLERTLQRHPKTVYIACHLANLDYDLTRLGKMFERYPNLYADNSARYAETATIPRFTAQFYQKYADRVVYGTDMPYNQRMFSTTFRVLESLDEHFYEQDLYFNFDYHWPMNGFGLPDAVLKKVYRDNLAGAFKQARGES
jgi:hypothetical protein